MLDMDRIYTQYHLFTKLFMQALHHTLVVTIDSMGVEELSH